MNKLIILFVLTPAMGCIHPPQKQAERALHTFSSFVDSIYTVNENWKKTNDTDYVEMFLSPHDLTKTKLDTIITLSENKKSIVSDPFSKVSIFEQYVPLKASVDSEFRHLDSPSQLRYRQAQKKFESLLVE